VVLPKFLAKRDPKQKNIRKVRELINDPRIHTVCESARCPNIGECFSRNTLTFMILGNICTRRCAFCGVEKGIPQLLDPEAPQRISGAARKLGLDYVVVTSVTRDDLPDGGASQFAAVIAALHPIKAEALIPDLQGNEAALSTVFDAAPCVLNHNLETVPHLYPRIRPRADYRRSLQVLKMAKNRGLYTKSGLMVGFGETGDEVIAVLRDLRGTGCDIVTIGQYLPPSRSHPRPERYCLPEEFEEYREIGKNLGFKKVFSGPFVRSSFHAKEAAEGLK